MPAHFMIFGSRNLFGQQFVQLLNQKRVSFTLANLSETNEQLSAEILEIAPSHIIFIFNASELTEGLNFYFLNFYFFKFFFFKVFLNPQTPGFQFGIIHRKSNSGLS